MEDMIIDKDPWVAIFDTKPTSVGKKKLGINGLKI
jgi:hypothetical protein